MGRQFTYTIIGGIVLVMAFGWLGTVLEWSAVVIITVSLVALALAVIVGLAVVGRSEKRDHERR